MCIMTTDETELADSESIEPEPIVARVAGEEAQRVLERLADAIRNSQRSRRDIERKLGWSHGYLGCLLKGRIALKVWHVFALARELGVEPLALLVAAVPPRDPSWILDYLGAEPVSPEPEPPKPRVPLDFDELEEMTRNLLYTELEKLGLIDNTI